MGLLQYVRSSPYESTAAHIQVDIPAQATDLEEVGLASTVLIDIIMGNPGSLRAQPEIVKAVPFSPFPFLSFFSLCLLEGGL